MKFRARLVEVKYRGFGGAIGDPWESELEATGDAIDANSALGRAARAWYVQSGQSSEVWIRMAVSAKDATGVEREYEADVQIGYQMFVAVRSMPEETATLEEEMA